MQHEAATTSCLDVSSPAAARRSGRLEIHGCEDSDITCVGVELTGTGAKPLAVSGQPWLGSVLGRLSISAEVPERRSADMRWHRRPWTASIPCVIIGSTIDQDC
jgi:hypothetical protein